MIILGGKIKCLIFNWATIDVEVFLVLVKIHKIAYTVLPSSFLIACILYLRSHILILRFLSFFFWGGGGGGRGAINNYCKFAQAYLEGS